jgi:hypothetical protein
MSYWWISRLVIVLLAVSIACYVIDRSSFCQKSEGFENSASSNEGGDGGGDTGDGGDSRGIPETRMTQAYPDDASYAPPPPQPLPPTDSSTPDTGSENDSDSDSDSDDSDSDNENDDDENENNAADSDTESDISENENECNATATATAIETTVTAETYTDTYTDTTDTTAYVYADTGDGTSNTTTSRAAAEVQPRDDTDQCSARALSSAPIMSYGNTYFPHTSWTVPQQRPPPCTANAQPLVMPVYTGGVPEGAMELQSSTNHQLLPTTYTGTSSSSAAAQPDTPATYRSYYPGYHARVAAT